jgi:hypothetical protein
MEVLVQMPVRCHDYLNFISKFTYIIHNPLRKFKANLEYYNVDIMIIPNAIKRHHFCASWCFMCSETLYLSTEQHLLLDILLSQKNMNAHMYNWRNIYFFSD